MQFSVNLKKLFKKKATKKVAFNKESLFAALASAFFNKIFLNKKKWVIAGGRVVEGKAEVGAMVRVIREGETLFETNLESLKLVKEDVRELEKDSDCGIKIATPKPIEPGDILEVFKVEKIERKLD